jgi:hypothetical protein
MGITGRPFGVVNPYNIGVEGVCRKNVKEQKTARQP